MGASINRRASFEEVAAAYARALARGYSPESIEEGYRRYTARYRRDNPETTQYAHAARQLAFEAGRALLRPASQAVREEAAVAGGVGGPSESGSSRGSWTETPSTGS